MVGKEEKEDSSERQWEGSGDFDDSDLLRYYLNTRHAKNHPKDIKRRQKNILSLTPYEERISLMKILGGIYPEKTRSNLREGTEDKEGKRECMVGKEEKEDSSERQWEGSGV